MTTDEKFAALKLLCETSLRMRAPRDWYVSASGRECKNGCILRSSYGNGSTPQEAIEDDWRIISSHPCIVIDYGKRQVRWNRYMWEDVV